MRRAHDLPILIGEPFVITANRDANSQSSWDSLIRSQLGNNRPGAVQAPMGLDHLDQYVRVIHQVGLIQTSKPRYTEI